MSNKIYYIYEIEGVKVGCTVNVEHRMKEQGYSNPIILEEHTDIYEASNREIELQKEKGYPIDTIPYWKAVENRKKWDNTHTNIVANQKLFGQRAKENGSLLKRNIAGTLAKRKLTFEEAEHIRNTFKVGVDTYQSFARQYQVSRNTIGRILKGHTYKTPLL